MARAPARSRRVKNSVNVGYSSIGRSASLASTPYLRAKARITARITGFGAFARQAAPTARLKVFFGNRRRSVYESSAIGLSCIAARPLPLLLLRLLLLLVGLRAAGNRDVELGSPAIRTGRGSRRLRLLGGRPGVRPRG